MAIGTRPGPTVGRRTLLLGPLVVAPLAATAACATDSSAPATSASSASSASSAATEAAVPTSTRSARTLLVVFSRAGENYYNGGRTDLATGNTEVLAGILSEAIDCDVHRIEAAEPYPDDYEATVARNSQEQDADARPAIANPLPALDPYDTVLIGSPIWNVRVPMIMLTFTEALDFAGKSVHPFVTYAVSGLGRTEEIYAESCSGADVGTGLAIRGEDVGDGADGVREQALDWLREIGLPVT